MKRRLKSTRHHVRATIKEVYTVLWASGLRIHPDKTSIGRVEKSVDFTGVHYCPTGMMVSEATLSRRDHKVTRLYEQGASKLRVGAYLRRWLGWVGGRGVALMTLGLAIGSVLWGCANEAKQRKSAAEQMGMCVERREKLIQLEERLTGEKGCRPDVVKGCQAAKTILLRAADPMGFWIWEQYGYTDECGTAWPKGMR